LKNRDLRVTILVNVPVNVPVKISKTQQKVLSTVNENASATAVQIAQSIGVTDKTVKRALSALKTANMIERVGSDKTGHWVIK